MDDIKNRKKDSLCILGYGNLGKELYKRLKHTNTKTYIVSRPKECIYDENLDNFYPLSSQNIIEIFKICDIVVNTIPYNVIPEEAVNTSYVPYILDIASAPYGINPDIIKKYSNVDYNLYLNIPSKFAPKEAANILLKQLKKEINLQ